MNSEYKEQVPDLGVEQSRQSETEIRPEQKFEKPEVDPEREAAAIERVRNEIEHQTTESSSQSDQASKIAIYQDKYIPDYLKTKQNSGGMFAKLNNWMLRAKERFGRFKTEGQENIPESGAFLLISNHSGGETNKLLGAFADHPLHIAAGEQLNWKRSKFRSWLLKKMGMISVKESLAHLSDDQKRDLFEKAPERSKPGYESIIEQEAAGKLAMNRDFIRNAVALLSRGEPVAVFPEGLFDYDEKRQLRQGYSGIELIAREYKKLTGQELPVLPVAVRPDSVTIGKVSSLSENTTNESDTDFAMRRIADLLPEQERGPYVNQLKT